MKMPTSTENRKWGLGTDWREVRYDEWNCLDLDEK